MKNELGNQFWNHHSLEELAEEQQVNRSTMLLFYIVLGLGK